MSRSIAAMVAAAVVAVLVAAFFCPTAAAAFYANPDADVQIVGLPEQVYAGGESFFIVVLANDQPFFDESLDEEGAVGVRLNITNGIVTAIEGSTFETNTSVGYDNITLYRDYISKWNYTLAVVRFAPTGAGDAVHINASGWIKDKDKPLFSDRYVSTDSEDAMSGIIDYSNVCDVSTLSELALKRKAFYNNSIKMLGAINGATAMDSNINAAWLGAIVYTGSLAYSIKSLPVTIPSAAGYALEQSLNGYTDVTNPGGTFGGYGFNLLTSSVNNMLQAMKTEMDYGGDIGNAINAMQDMELALDDESGKWGARDAAGLQFILGENERSDWQRGEKRILETGSKNIWYPVHRVQYISGNKITAKTDSVVDVYAYQVSTAILEFVENDYDYVTKVIELPVDSNGNGLFDFEERAEPIPSLTNLEPSVEMEVGETRDLVFTLTNAGNDSDVGYLDLSVSSGIEIVANSSDAADMLNYTLAPGEDAFFSDGYEHPLTYSLFGAYKPYAEGESVTVTITIEATAAGEVWLKYRLSMMNSSGEYIRIPNAGVKDQQGWYAHETTVTVIDPANSAPDADAGCDQGVSEGTAVTLNGSGSSDSDGGVARYVWREGGGVIGSGCVIGRTFSAGTHTVTLTVTDCGGKSDSDTVVVTVTANAAPVADAGCDQSVVSGAVVTLDGSGSSDSDGEIEYYEWQEDGVFLGSGATLGTVFAPGVHEITLYVVDDGGKVGVDEVGVEVAASGVPEEEWNVTFGGSGGEVAFSVQQTLDGGYILAGYTDSYGAGDGDSWLVKTDSSGNHEWNRTFGGTDDDGADSVQQTADGGYILAGHTNTYGAGSYDFWLVKTDSTGNHEWDRTFGGTYEDYAHSVQETTDGGYILAGYTDSYGAGYGDFWLVKTDSGGNHEWDRTFGGTSYDYACSVEETSDGGYILAGKTRSYGAGNTDFWLVKTDSAGNEEWSMTFGGTDYDCAYSCQQTADGGYILAGYTDSYGAGDRDSWLVKTNSSGNHEWNRTFGGTSYAVARSVHETSDGGYILAGYTDSYGAGDWDSWLVKTDSSGNHEWNRTFGGTYEDCAHSVQETTDGGYILVGFTSLYSADPYDYDVWLIKLSPEGDTDDTTAADIYVNTTGWWRDDGAFNSSSTPIQAAVDAASAGDTIFVWNGSYNENVDVNKTLTLEGEGADVVTVTAVSTRDHVFNVTADSVNISGFTVTGTTCYSAAGIYLNNVKYCIISENNASGNDYGIRLSFSDSNTLTNNIANSNDWYGICLWDSSNNVLADNTANLSNWDGGIHLEGSSNNTLANNTASLNNDEGIYLSYLSNNNTITNNIANSNGWYGIYLEGSSNNMLTNNNASNNSNGGIYLGGSSNNSLENNTCSNGSIYLYGSGNNTLKNNIMSGNTCNFGVWGYDLFDYIQNIGTSNTVNGKPIYYWVNHKGEQIPDDAGFVGVVNSTNITVRDMTLTNNTWAVLFAYTDNSRIENIITSNGYGYGINLQSSSNNMITNNTSGSIYLRGSNNNRLTNNNNISIMLGDSNNNTLMNNNASNNWGISLFNSSHNILHNNIANSNVDYGIELSWNSDDNTLSGNTVNSNNECGIYLKDSSKNTLQNNIVNSNGNHYNHYGICLHSSSNNTLQSNTANSNGWYGIYMGCSSNNTLTNNIVNSNGWCGIYLDFSSNNAIICNLVQNNKQQGIFLCWAGTDNNISYNNLIENGALQADGSYHWQFINNQPDAVEAKHNYWGDGMNTSTIIDASIFDEEDRGVGRVDFYPFETEPITCATDITPPTLTITSPAPNTTTHTPTITIAGTASDASGIASVTVNGEPANGTLDWSANVTLVAGENTIPVVATDGAGLNTTETVTVYRTEPFTFVHITDVHLGFTFLDIEIDDRTETFTESIEKFTDTLQAVKTHNPDFILSPGDLVEYSNNDFFDAYMGILESLDIPVYNTPGNHDRRGWDPREDVGLTVYDGIVTNPSNIESLNDGYRDYYFDKHGYRFIGLDTGADYNVSLPFFLESSNVSTLASHDDFYDSSPEGDGLKDIQLTGLSEMDSTIPKIIFMHHPAVDDSDDESATWSLEPPVTNNCPEEYGGNDACIAFNRCEFIEYCVNNTVDIVLTGHTHEDYIKIVPNDARTHETQFIQTRSATKESEPSQSGFNSHGYRVINVTNGENSCPAYLTEETLEKNGIGDRYTFIGDFPNGACYVEKEDNTTGTDKNGNILREIPNTYYTEPLGSEYQVIVYYLFKNGEPDDLYLCKKKPVDSEASSISTSQTTSAQESAGDITINHRTENMTVKYIYEDITLGAAENATASVNFSSENTNHTMEFDDDGDGVTDNVTEPTHIIINHAPEISITTPAGEESGNVTIPYNLKDAESDDCTIISQYSLNNITWIGASVGEAGCGVINLTSAPDGVDHTFVWASGTDIPHTNATVYFRIRPYDGDLAGDYATTSAFSVDNRVRGDLNHDGILTPTDAAIALEIAAGSRPCDAAMLDAADVSGDGCVTSLDALMILQGCG